MYALQVGTKNNAGYYGDDNQGPSSGNKRKGNGVASVDELEDVNTLSIYEKQSRILTMVMWYLPVSDRLRRFF